MFLAQMSHHGHACVYTVDGIPTECPHLKELLVYCAHHKNSRHAPTPFRSYFRSHAKIPYPLCKRSLPVGSRPLVGPPVFKISSRSLSGTSRTGSQVAQENGESDREER
jgi:hypothetical protein